ncbi:hypothetical protein F53441_11934 [Fusarium austroafricanum]|uniref:Uncharacterized protein n=1 Tax=Fusarium austroafricanum TaxID=2364996 RepID=A0A8H4K1K2_9HYPO|nr:hypothetical protein F53441_11934 [Fusarium austroafricanum]
METRPSKRSRHILDDDTTGSLLISGSSEPLTNAVVACDLVKGIIREGDAVIILRVRLPGFTYGGNANDSKDGGQRPSSPISTVHQLIGPLSPSTSEILPSATLDDGNEEVSAGSGEASDGGSDEASDEGEGEAFVGGSDEASNDGEASDGGSNEASDDGGASDDEFDGSIDNEAMEALHSRLDGLPSRL